MLFVILKISSSTLYGLIIAIGNPINRENLKGPYASILSMWLQCGCLSAGMFLIIDKAFLV